RASRRELYVLRLSPDNGTHVRFRGGGSPPTPGNRDRAPALRALRRPAGGVRPPPARDRPALVRVPRALRPGPEGRRARRTPGPGPGEGGASGARVRLGDGGSGSRPGWDPGRRAAPLSGRVPPVLLARRAPGGARRDHRRVEGDRLLRPRRRRRGRA